MIARTLRIALVVLATGLAASPAAAQGNPPRQVAVTGTRVHLGDLLPDADAAAAAVDVGPSPAAGGSRLITRADLVAALEARQVPAPPNLPESVRVLRKAKHLSPADMDVIVRDALAAKRLGRGVSIASVRAEHPSDVADGWTRVDVELPRAPKKAGPFVTVAIASFFDGDDVLARIPVPIDLAVSEEGATYDTPRGAALTLIVRRTLVEVRATGFAGVDADVGDTLPVQLRPSGRVLRARLVARDEAVAIEDGR